MKAISLLLIMKLLLLLIDTSNVEAQSRDHLFLEHTGTTMIDIGDDFYLVNPRTVTGNENIVIWVQHNALIFFSHDGKLIKKIETIGSGPGEFRNITYAVVQENLLHVFESSLNKILIYRLKDLELIDEVRINVHNSRIFTVDLKGNYYFQHIHIPHSNVTSFSVFNSSGEKIDEFGEVPIYGALSWNLLGGGITANDEGNVYYSYFGDPNIYQFDKSIRQVLKIGNNSDYFKIADETQIKTMIGDTDQLIRYAFTVSRPVAMFYNDGYIFQVVEDDHPWSGKPIKYFLEIWDEENKKVTEPIPLKSRFIFFGNGYLYNLAQGQSNFYEHDLRIDFIDRYSLSE